MNPTLVIIPIFNAPVHLTRCLASLDQNLTDDTEVLLVDDASTDPRVGEILDGPLHTRYHVLRIPSNGGFVLTANAGLKIARYLGRDALLLNSDTEVTPGWLDRMRRCLYSDPKIGIVSPLSNAATIYSIPSQQERLLPLGQTPDAMAEIVATHAKPLYPRAPTGHGFCMLIRNELLNTIGLLDEAFGRGYGEECDYSMRARVAGWECVACDDVYVYHATGASFGKEGSAMTPARKRNAALIAERWPTYEREVRAHVLCDPLRELRTRVQRSLSPRAQQGRLNVLSIVHTYGAHGGTELHTEEITNYMRAAGHDARVLTPRATLEAQALGHVHMLDPNLVPPAPVVFGSRQAVESILVARAVRDVIRGCEPHVVHLQHTLGYGHMDLASVAKREGAKVVISVHDYHALCPRYILANDEPSPCGQAELCDSDECRACIGSSFTSREAMAAYARARRDAVARAFSAADTVVFVSDFARDMITRVYPEVVGKSRVIRYGFDLRVPRMPMSLFHEGPLRVTVLGNLTKIKGSDDVIRIARAVDPERVQITVRGGLPPGVTGIAAKPYRPEELSAILAETDVVLLASRVHETFCRTLDEALYCCVPVVASAVGAIPERLQHGVNGLLYPLGAWRKAVQYLRKLARDRKLLFRLRSGAVLYPRKTSAACHAEYLGLYEELVK